MHFKPKFVYFDLDDTLLDHKRAEVAALNDLYGYFDEFEFIESERLIDIYHTVNGRQWLLYGQGKVDRYQLQRNRFELTLKELDINPALHKEVGTYYMRCYQNHWNWVDGAREAFDVIRSKFEIGILTNGFSETQKKKFKHFNLYDKVKHLVISEETGYLKPRPEIFEHATQLTGHAASDILYIGDSFNSDIIGASGYGWKTAWYNILHEEDQGEKADFIFSDFDDLREYLGI